MFDVAFGVINNRCRQTGPNVNRTPSVKILTGLLALNAGDGRMLPAKFGLKPDL